jgi:hypothetical protein
VDLAFPSLLDRSDSFEQGHNGVPLDVVARRVLEKLEQGVAMIVAEMNWGWT